MTCLVRRAFVAGVLVLTSIISGCSGSPRSAASGAIGTSGGPEAAFVDLDLTPALAIAIANHASQPLLNVNVAIKPVSGAALYTTTLPRMEPGETRTLAFGLFRRPDGTPFSTVLSFVRPKEVTVTAVDRDGQKHQLTVPWRT